MNSPLRALLTINGGSSSIRFAIYEADDLRRVLAGKVDRIGLSGTELIAGESGDKPQVSRPISGSSHSSAVQSMLGCLEAQPAFACVGAIGHRVVHGMSHSDPELVTPALLEELHRITPYDPDHLPREIELIEAFQHRHPKLPQVACFDTAFHRTMPRIAKLLPIPRRYDSTGVQRYGFHG